jgi:hypothetical protein
MHKWMRRLVVDIVRQRPKKRDEWIRGGDLAKSRDFPTEIWRDPDRLEGPGHRGRSTLLDTPR